MKYAKERRTLTGGTALNGTYIATRTLIQAGVIAFVLLFVLLLLYAAEIFLVVFAGILVAILFCGLSEWIHKKTDISEKWSLAISLLGPFLLICTVAWFIAPEVSKQAGEMSERLPKAVAELKQQLQQYDWVNRLMARQDQLREALPSGSKAVDFAGKFFSSTFGALGNFIIVLAVGIFLAVNPKMYFDGLVRLVPLQRRTRTREVLEATRSTLASWLAAKLTAMLVIGVLTTIGLWLIGVDLALVLGIIAALLSFVPNFGPIIALVPAVLIALVGGIDQVLYVTGLYIAIQTVESYILTPLLQQHMVDLPPALTIGTQVLIGFLTGALGVILATPLTAAAVVITKMWYVEDLLGDRNPDSG